ncbi:MAG: globin [Epsilonproteobacteria bacterium]|nr:globin [Campylobacterota bacterium]
MAFKITPTIEGEKVEYENPSAEFYKAIGEEEGMRNFMYSFYDIIYKSDIHNFFPQDKEAFDLVKEKNTKFFIQLCGGPKVYEKELGGMDFDEYMIRVHDDFSIPEKARTEWLGCMREALSDVDMDEALKENFWNYCEQFSKLTVNQFPDKKPNPYF